MGGLRLVTGKKVMRRKVVRSGVVRREEVGLI